MSMIGHEVSTTRVSGWVAHSIWGWTYDPPADAGGTDFTSLLLELLV